MTQQKIPKVKFGLLGEECYVTDFIQVNNSRMQQLAAKIKGKNVNEIIAKVARYVAKNIAYALNSRGQPTAHRHTKVFRFYGPIYLCDTGEVPYGWLLPNQLYAAGYGICFDTAAFTCTLLRIKKLEAYVVMGAVSSSKSRKLRGFHAWVETFDKDQRKLVIETTSPKKPAIFAAADIYGGQMPETYEPICWFNESFWREDKAKAEKYVEEAINVLKKKGAFTVQAK